MHIELDALAGKDILLAGLTGHFVSQRNTLGLCGDQQIEVTHTLEQFLRAADCHLHITKHYKAGNGQIVVQRADGQVTFQTSYMQLISFHLLLLLFY